MHDLRWLDMRPVLLTGDHEAAARTVAAEVGIDDVIADVLPQQKVAEVVRLQDRGIASPWSVMGSTTRQRWLSLILVSRSAPARMQQFMPAT